MLKKIFIGLAIFLAVFAAVVALQPAAYRVARSTTITAPPALIFGQVNDLHKWQEFSPWTKLDPSAKITFEGPVAGTGATFTWAGNSDIGAGRMTLTECHPTDLIRFRLDFTKPFEDTSIAEFAFKPAGNQTEVTWSMSGRKNFVSKAVCLFVSMDKMLGGDFEDGLARLKSLSEAAAKK